ncbi:MAG: choice-of-anchor D domain-containing protein, partial [Myxococcales bacterium]
GGQATLVTSTTVDFGPSLVGERLERKVKVRNNGRGDFRISQITRDPAFSDAFRYHFEPTVVPVGESRDITFFFEPTEQGDFEGLATMEIIDGSSPTLPVTLKGRGVRGGCVIEPAETADFGAVATGTSYVMPIAIRNNSELEWKVTIGDITSQSDEGAFAFANDFKPGEYQVPANDGIVVPIEFRPNHVGQHSAFLAIPAPSMCKPSVLPLVGNGVDQVLIWMPQQVDFGFVNPGTKVESSVVFKNLGNRDVTISGLAITNDTRQQFSLETSTTTFVVAKAGGEVEVPLGFKPSILGPQSARLAFTSDDPKLTAGTVNLKGYGGGPDIDVQPKRVDFGPVAIGSFQYRRIVIANTGTDAPSTTDDNLKLEAKDSSGKPVARMPVLVDNPSNEFALDLPPVGYSTAGIQAGASVDLRVKFNPTSPGKKQARIKIYSNDPDESEVEVTVEAEGRVMPPCDYEIVPPQLRFGNVEVSRNKTMSYYIRNRGTNECFVSTVELARGSNAAYSLPAGPYAQFSIAAGEDKEIPVRFAPTATGTSLEGEVVFYISSVTAPEGKVKLSGSSQAGCLLVTPDDLDFGVIQTNCNSRERVFSVYNVCNSTVTITGIDVQAGLSNEFRVSSRPAFPHSIAAGGSVEFKAVYRPTDVGSDQGSIAVQTAQLSQP